MKQNLFSGTSATNPARGVYDAPLYTLLCAMEKPLVKLLQRSKLSYPVVLGDSA